MLSWLLPKDFPFILVAALLGSCGLPARSARNELPPAEDPDNVFKIGVHNLEDPSCQQAIEAVSVEHYQGWVWDGFSTQAHLFNAEDVISSRSLSSRAVISTWYGQQQVEACKLRDGNLDCDRAAEVTQAAMQLRICQSEALYDRESVEGVALTGLHQLNEAWKFYQSIPGSRPDIGRSNLLVLPEIRQNYEVIRNGGTENHSSTISSNLAYVASFKNAPTFVIYPTAPIDAPNGLTTKPNLWESPWGMAHEFGHHVLRTHTRRSSFDTARLEDKEAVNGRDFDERHRAEAGNPQADLMVNGRSVGAKDHWQAINEGFADLFAFYSLDQRADLAKNIPCLDVSRDVLSAEFANGRLKSLDAAALGLYTSSEFVAPGDCKGSNFQGPHSIGAVIAYGVNRLFQASEIPGRNGSDQSGKLLLAWADKLGILADLGADAISLSEMVRLAVETAAALGNRLTNEQCRILGDVFPIWKEQWVGGASNGKSFQCRD